MPIKAKKPCPSPRCPNLTTGGFCLDHQKKTERVYDWNWAKYSKAYLVANPWCSCGRPSVATDHIKPVARGGSMWDPTNHQPLCKACHNKKTAAERD